MANITQIKHHHVLDSGTVGGRRNIFKEIRKNTAASLLTTDSFSKLSPIYTSQNRHGSILPVPRPAGCTPCIHFVPTSHYFKYFQLNSKLNPKDRCKFRVTFCILDALTFVNLKCICGYQQN